MNVSFEEAHRLAHSNGERWHSEANLRALRNVAAAAPIGSGVAAGVGTYGTLYVAAGLHGTLYVISERPSDMYPDYRHLEHGEGIIRVEVVDARAAEVAKVWDRPIAFLHVDALSRQRDDVLTGFLPHLMHKTRDHEGGIIALANPDSRTLKAIETTLPCVHEVAYNNDYWFGRCTGDH